MALAAAAVAATAAVAVAVPAAGILTQAALAAAVVVPILPPVVVVAAETMPLAEMAVTLEAPARLAVQWAVRLVPARIQEREAAAAQTPRPALEPAVAVVEVYTAWPT